MNTFLNGLKNELNYTETENGAVALKSTMYKCLDAFGSLGAMKDSLDTTIIATFEDAFLEDRKTAMRLLFYIRDIRGGQGMRRVFRVCLKWLAENHSEYVVNNLCNIMEFGRADDMLCLLDTCLKDEVIKFVQKTLYDDYKAMSLNTPCTLMAKWLPAENASSAETKRYGKIIRKGLGWTPRTYRKNLTALRKYIDVVEVKMSYKKWDEIDYEKVPAKASSNYSDAFDRNDSDRYNQYLCDLMSGKAKVNAKSLFPYDVFHKVNTCRQYGNIKKNQKILYNAMWEALPNYFEGNDESAICMVDTSGSMSGVPYEVAVSLGVYCADKCHGPFHNHFITFAEKPELVGLRGDNFVDKSRSLRCINAYNTDIEAAFDLILKTAIRNKCSQEDLPAKLYIISDMQFDEARGDTSDCKWRKEEKPNQTFMQTMKKRFADAGYTMPALVYWNVRASDCGMFQEKFDGENCCMVSGYSSSLFKAVINGTTYEETINENGKVSVKQKIDPMTVMYNTLYGVRYDCIWVG